MQRIAALWGKGFVGKVIVSLVGSVLACCVLGTVFGPRQPRQEIAAPAAQAQAQVTALIPSTTAQRATATPMPTHTPVPPTPTLAPPIGQVLKVGNLRSEPRIAADTVVALICPDDTVAFISRAIIGDAYWYRVRLETTATDCDSQRAQVGTEGWASSSLLGAPSYTFENYAADAQLALPTTVRSTPIPKPTVTPRPVVRAAPAAPSGGRIGAICRDGTRSSATGRGACSHHGGVAQWLYSP
jgi:hypothetical protein